MSKFQTRIPVPVQPLLDSLPGGTYVHSYTYDEQKHELTVVWESEGHHTGYTFPVDITPEDLGSGKALKRFKAKPATLTQPKAKNAPTVKTDAENTPSVAVPDHNWTKERFEEEKAKGTAIEYQGVEPVWKPVEAEHKFEDGFLYRKKVVAEPIDKA